MCLRRNAIFMPLGGEKPGFYDIEDK